MPQQFFPNSDRPELVVELRLKEGSSFAATTEQVKKMEAVLAKDEGVKFFTAYTGAGQPRFYLSLNPELPNPSYAAFIVMTKGVDGSRKGAGAAHGDGQRRVPRSVGPRHAARARPAGGFPGAVPGRGSGYAEGARDRARGRSGGGREPQGARRAARLERSRSYAARRHRPGKGACARACSCRRVVCDADADKRRHAVASARARGPRRHRRARDAVGAPRPRHAEGRQSLYA